MEKITFYKELPQGYEPVKTIDAGNKKMGIIMNLGALLLAAVVGIVTFLLRFTAFPAAMDVLREDMAGIQDNIWQTEGVIWGTLGVMFVYIVLHELTHGAAYKLLTKEKLTYGIKLTCAFCGVPNVYVTRKTALIALLSPFTVFNVVFLALTVFTSGWLSLCALFLFAAHFGGCIGDLYDTCLLLFKYKGDVLVNDNGPKQVFYA